MNEKDMKNIAKILVIIAVALCGVSLILPWNGFSMNIMGASMGVEFYPWGGHAYMNLGALSGYYTGGTTPSSMDMWSILYILNAGAPASGTSGTTTANVTSGDIASTAALIFSFIFAILTLVFGLISLKSIKQKKSIMPLFAAIASLITIILFFAGISMALSSDTTGVASSMFKWTYGFFIMIISMILFFISFGVIKSIKEQSDMPFTGTIETTLRGPSKGTGFPPQ